MAIPEIVGTATNGRAGTGSFAITPPAGAGGYLAFMSWRGAPTDITAPSGWTLVERGYASSPDDFTPYGIWKADASPGSSWSYGFSDTAHGMVVGYDAAITIEQRGITFGTDAESLPTPCPSVTTTNPALIVRAFTGDLYNLPPDGIVYPSGATLGRAQSYRASGSDNYTCAVAHSSQSTPGATGTATWATGSTATRSYYPAMSTIAITSSGGAPAGPTFKVWNGTAEVAATMKVWNGTAEVDATALEVTS